MPKNSVPEWDSTAGNNTDVGGVSTAEGQLPGLLNNAIREAMSQIVDEVATQGSDIASASSIDLGASNGPYVKVTGTTTITALGTVRAGTRRWVEFTGALTLTHNATSLKLPGAANITTVAGDTACFVSLGSGNWKCLSYVRTGGTPIVSGTVGKHKLWIPAAAIRPQTTTGASSADNTATNVQYFSLDLDQNLVEGGFFNVSMPSSADETAGITYVPVWTAASGSGDVVFEMFAWAFGNDDALAASFGTTTLVTDTLIATGDLHRGPESAALTITNTWAANDLLVFGIFRVGTDGGDTLNADAKLIGVELYITTDAAVDTA